MTFRSAWICIALALVPIAASAEPDSVGILLAIPDSPPVGCVFPSDYPGVLSRPAPAYPESAWIAGLEERVVVMARLDTTGRVVRVQYERGSTVFEHAALDAVRRWTFSPYIDQGRPIAVGVLIPIMFRLDETPPPGDSAATSLGKRSPTRRTPFNCLPADSSPLQIRRDVAHALVDAQGRVRNVRFALPAPSDSVAIRASILTWTFPATPAGGKIHATQARDSWIRVPIVRSCPPQDH